VLLLFKEGQEIVEDSKHMTASLVAHAAKQIRQGLSKLSCAEEDSVERLWQCISLLTLKIDGERPLLQLLMTPLKVALKIVKKVSTLPC